MVNTLASGIYYARATPAQDMPKPSYTAYTFPFNASRTLRRRAALGHDADGGSCEHSG
jgi:hypothetical protein